MTAPFSGPEFAELEARLAAAKVRLGDAMEQASRDLRRFQRENQPSPEVRREMQQMALRGALGNEMRQLAEKVDRGEDDWDSIFAARSPNSHLLQGHLSRAVDANRAAITQAFEEGDDLEPELDEQDR